jgi:hypothetical protein
MRNASMVSFMLLFAGIGTGQIANPISARDMSPSEKGLAALLDRVSGLPAEYKADLGFAIIDANPNALSPARKRDLLDDIFTSAANAHYPNMVSDAARQADSLSHQTVLTLARNRSDALDIQTRAIEHALPSTPQFAKHLFEELSLGGVRASCKDATVENVSAFYVTAKRIIQDKRIKTVFKQDKAQFLQSLASNMRVPAQIAPLATLITQVSVSPVQLEQIEGIFVSSFGTITASDREMTAAVERSNLTNAIKALSDKLTQSGISSVPLLAAFRGFLLRGLTQEICADHSLDRAEMAKQFNDLLPSASPESSDVSPLSATHLTAKSTGASAFEETVPPLNEQLLPQLRRIGAAYRARIAEEYRLGHAGTIESEPSDVEAVVQYAISLEPGDKCPVCDFYSKGTLFMILLDILPAGAQLERAINAEVDYLSSNPVQKDNPPAWLAIFNELINASRKPNDEAKAALAAEAKKGAAMTLWGTPSPEAIVIRKSLRRLSDPVIAAYMSADDQLHLPYLTIMQQAQAK